MKILKCLLISLVLFLVITLTTTKTADAACSLDIPCAYGSVDPSRTRIFCFASSSDCGCTVREARTCKASYGPCIGSNTAWEKWECSSMVCPCEDGGLADGEW